MSKFYRTIIQIEVLSKDPFECTDLSEINYAITEGDCSGKVEIIQSEKVPPEKMAELLKSQGSDPNFLLEEYME